MNSMKLDSKGVTTRKETEKRTSRPTDPSLHIRSTPVAQAMLAKKLLHGSSSRKSKKDANKGNDRESKSHSSDGNSSLPRALRGLLSSGNANSSTTTSSNTASSNNSNRNSSRSAVKETAPTRTGSESNRSSVDLERNHQHNDVHSKSAETDSIQNMANYITSPIVNSVTPEAARSMAELKRFLRPPTALFKRSLDNSNTSNTAITTKNKHTHSKDDRRIRNKRIPSIEPSTIFNNDDDDQRSIVYKDDKATDKFDLELNTGNESSLLEKYGKLGKLLGSGASGSVKIVIRPSDNTKFAVKEFRQQNNKMSTKQYIKNCNAEFLIGSSLHHPNIVETIDMIDDTQNLQFYEIMEYLPVDFFDVVMSNQMSRLEINCCFKQLIEGIAYLHENGIAHRDLKLDNCCMNEQGILKIIDFGSAFVFKYPYERETLMASGIVGSDPYLAPEILSSTGKYDPVKVDVWSLAIIYCCMILKRFPWSVPRSSDKNFQLFCKPDNTEHDYVKSAREHVEIIKKKKEKKIMERKVKKQIKEREKNVIDRDSLVNKLENIVERADENNDKGITKREATVEAPQSNVIEKGTGVKESNNGNGRTIIKGQKNFNEESSKSDSSNEKGSKIEQEIEIPEKSGTREKQDRSSPINNQKGKQETSHTSEGIEAQTEPNPPQTKKIPVKDLEGPYRLFRLLPHRSRPILSEMLAVDPNERPTMPEVLQNEWVHNIEACTVDMKTHKTVRASGHHHTIVKSGQQPYKV